MAALLTDCLVVILQAFRIQPDEAHEERSETGDASAE